MDYMNFVSRRTFIQLSSGLLGATFVPGCTMLSRPDLDVAAIDVHCHVFNASDLSIKGFVQRVALDDYEEPVKLPAPAAEQEAFFQGLAALLVEILSLRAISAKTEATFIRRGVGNYDETTAEESQRRELQRILDNFLVPGEPPLPGTPPRETDEPNYDESYNPLIKRMKEELAPQMPGLSPTEISRPEAMAEGLMSSAGNIGRSIQWAFSMLRSRRRIVSDYQCLYAGAQRVAMFTPALVDFEFWLDDEPRSPFADQIEVMHLLQLEQTKGAIMHCFAPFDPWRQVMDEQDGRKPSALDLVKYAIMDCGFVGVKLYPPMGFRPAGNNRSMEFPERVLTTVRDPGTFPNKLNSALWELYDWCDDNGVPIMAHATNSNDAADGFARRASPENWQEVLRDKKRLRINMAHFGGFDEDKDGNKPESTWEWKFGHLLNDGHEGAFADMSYLSEFLGENATTTKRKRIEELLTVFKNEFDPGLNHLLYGSDWIMLGKEKAPELMPNVMEALLTRSKFTERQKRNFFRDNAVRYLGLHPDGKNRKRLNTYYKDHHLDLDRLKRLAG